MKENNFYTLKGYQLQEDGLLTPALEDYLEMIYRIEQQGGTVKVAVLSKKLNVRPSSASKMVGQLKELGYIKAESYGEIQLTEKGLENGKYLLYRHRVIYDFLRFLNGAEGQLKEAERLEHFLGRTTVDNLDKFLKRNSR